MDVMRCFQDSDVLHLVISQEQEADSVELSPNITAELNDGGDIIGVEILGASEFLRDSLLETVQARLLTPSGKMTERNSLNLE